MGEIKTPWLKHYGAVPAHLNYPDYTMEEALEAAAKKYPNYIAYEFMGKKTTYQKAVRDIHLCAKALRAMGIQENDRVTVCMPNAPQTVMMFYALNVIGAVSNMVHPLSSENEIAFYLNDSRSVAAITLDQFYGKFAAIRGKVRLNKLIITSIADALSPVLALGYKLTEGRKIPPVAQDGWVVLWKDFLAAGGSYMGEYISRHKAEEGASILYSGGTTGVTKGILLSNLNFNALACQTVAANPMFLPGDTMLSIMPMFHGFGLGIGIHTVLSQGAPPPRWSRWRRCSGQSASYAAATPR